MTDLRELQRIFASRNRPSPTAGVSTDPVAPPASPVIIVDRRDADPSGTASTEDATAPAESKSGLPTKPRKDSAKRRRKSVDLPKSSRRIDRWGMNPEDRARVMEQCLLLQRPGWKVNFALMMLMAVVVAIMGLSANSAAVVIGAMLIAPLMTPVLGVAASIAMALGPPLWRSLITVVLASVGAIALGFLAGWLLPDGRPLLSEEIIARTQPDVKDLAVALAAGIAGSYATARPDTSSSLPGVAIAVALVPPLAVVGLTLQAGETSMAGGALLLYITNLAAIVFSSAVVFIVTGFVPARRLASTTPRVVLGALAALALLVFVGWRLTLTTLRTNDILTTERDVEEQIEFWLEGTGNDLDGFDVDTAAGRVSVQVSGPTDLPPTEQLVQALEPVLGEDIAVNAVRVPVQTGALRAPIDGTEVEAVIAQWIEDNGGPEQWEQTALQIGDKSITVNLTTTGDAPEDNVLQEQLQSAFDVETFVDFTESRPPEIDETSEEVITARIESLVSGWALDNDTELIDLELSFDGPRVTALEATVQGAVAPPKRSLENMLFDFEGITENIDLWFIERVPVLVATPTPVPTPTPEPTATPLPTPTPDPFEFNLVFPTPPSGDN